MYMALVEEMVALSWGSELLTVPCRIPLGLPKPGTAGNRIGVRRQSLRAGVGWGHTQSPCLGFQSPGQTYLVFPFSCPQTPLWRTQSTLPRTELTKMPLLSFGDC